MQAAQPFIRRARLSLAAGALAATLAWSAGPSPAAAGGDPHVDPDRTGAGVASLARARFSGALLRLQNRERRRHGLRRLKASPHLGRAARRHARDMVRRHYFGHTSRGGHDVVDRVAGTRYGRRTGFAVQENLYWWSRKRAPAAVLSAWLGSAAHRANVLGSRWRQFGVAAVMRSPYSRRGITVVGVYGARSRR